jgi:hypothetical protein
LYGEKWEDLFVWNYLFISDSYLYIYTHLWRSYFSLEQVKFYMTAGYFWTSSSYGGGCGGGSSSVVVVVVVAREVGLVVEE